MNYMYGKHLNNNSLIKRIHAGSLAMLLILTAVLSLGVFKGDNQVYAAESSVMGTNSYSPGKIGGATLTVGTTYILGSGARTGGSATPQVQVLAFDDANHKALVQSKGMWGAAWPGEGSLYNTAASYLGELKNVATDVYLPKGSNSNISVYWNGTQTTAYAGTVLGILKAAAGSYSSFGASYSRSWLGTPNGSSSAYYVHSSGSVNNNDWSYSYVCAPAFTIDTSRVALSGNTIEYAPFKDSTGITAVQSITEVEEGACVDLNQIITGVMYNDGDNDGRSASYTISINAENGSFTDGTRWNVLTGISSTKIVTLTIKDEIKNLTTTKTVSVRPRAARSITIGKKSDFPESITTGDTVDLSSYITVTGYDSGSQADGEITDYVISVNEMFGTVEGTTYTPSGISSVKDISITVTPNGLFGETDYSGVSAAFTVKVKPSTSGWTERDEYTDELGFHTYTDPITDITWKYRYNNDGYILYLYTEDNVENMISEGHVLLVPSSINGVSVIGIGGGSKDSSVIPFIPSEGENVNNSWTSIYIPSSVKIINDGAFYKNGASANIVIPSNVSEIGVNAFKESKITSVIFNNAKSLTLNTESFSNIPELKNVSIRGNGVTIKERVFSNAVGLSQIDIPYGTKFRGETDANNSHAFQGTTGLTLIKIDTKEVYSGIFSDNKNLEKVIFGEHVERVKFDWSGTAISNSETLGETVARATYVLNENTIFEMDKTTGGSPFGYANSLTVTGKNRSLDDDTDSYNNTTDPVTAKVAYLAKYYESNNEVKGYAQGTGESITITAEGNPADNENVTSTESDEQTGIEAYYSGVIFNGKSLEKNKTSVYKMYGDKQKEKHSEDEFYVIRTNDADTLLTEDNTNQKNESDEYVTTYTNEVLASFASKDKITITDSDISRGTIDVKVVVLKKDANGDILVDHSNGHVMAYSAAIAIPVREYTAENDFLENYGSYSAVISKINGLSEQVKTLMQTITDKDAELINIAKEKENLQQQYDDLENEQLKNEGIVADLNVKLEEKVQELERAQAEISSYKDQLSEYATAYNNLIEELKKYINETDTDDSGYFGTIISKDESTGEMTEREVVYIDGDPYDYKSTNEVFSIGDTTYPIYSGMGDLNHDGTSESFKFIVTKDGVTILIEVPDGEGGTDTIYMPGDTYSDPIGAIQRKAAAQLAAVSAQLENLKSDITGLEGQVSELQSQIGILNDRVSELESENEQLKNDKSELEEANKKLQEELEGLKAANAAALEEANAKAEELRRQLAEQEEAAKKAQEALENENATTEEKLEAAKTQITALNANIDTLQETNSSLQESLAAANVHVSTLEAEAEEYVSTLTTIANATGANATDYKDIIEKVQAQANTIEDVKKALGTTETSDLGSLVEDLVAAADGDVSALREQINMLTAEKAGLKEQVEQLKKDLEDAKKENGSDAEDAKIIADLKEEIASLNARNKSLSNQIADLTSQLANAGANNGSSADRSTIAMLNGTISTLTSNNSSLQSQITSLTSANGALSTQLSSAKASVIKLEDENAALSADKKTLSVTLDSTKKSLTSAKNRVNSLTQSNNKLKDGNKTYKIANSDLKEENSRLLGENISLKSQVSNLTAKLAAANNNTSGHTTTVKSSDNGNVAAHAPQTSETNATTTATISEVNALGMKGVSTENEKKDEQTKDEGEDTESIAGDINIVTATEKKISNAVGNTVSMSLPLDVDSDTGLIETLGGTSPLDLITTNGASISETMPEDKEHANEIFRFYASHIGELNRLGLEGVDEDSENLAIEGVASIDITPSSQQRQAIDRKEKACVEISYGGLLDGEDYLIVHESKVRVGTYDIQIVRAKDGELVFDLDDLSPVSFAHINKNAASVTVSSTLTGDENEVNITDETGKSNHIIKIIIVAVIIILAMVGFVFYSIRKGGKEKGNSSFSNNSFRRRSKA